MSNVVKKVIKKSREKVFSNIMASLHELNRAVAALHDKVGASEQALRQTQLEINHAQSQVLEEVQNRSKNSGIIPLSEKEIVAKIFSGLKMYLDPRDIAVVPHLVLDQIWEHRITAAWLSIIKPEDTVLDIGANFGYFGILAAQLTDKKKSKVIMFEPNPYLMPYVRKTLSVNWLNEQSTIENLAIADKEGEVVLNLQKDYIGSSSLLSDKELDKYMHNKMHVETQEAIPVKAVTIDGYCAKHKIGPVDLIKMDIEGYEDKAYMGMRKTIQASPNVTLFVEFTKDSYRHPKAFYDQMLQDFGNVYIINDDGRIVKPKKTNYETVIGDADDWVMPIFSKNAKLATE